MVRRRNAQPWPQSRTLGALLEAHGFLCIWDDLLSSPAAGCAEYIRGGEQVVIYPDESWVWSKILGPGEAISDAGDGLALQELIREPTNVVPFPTKR